MQAIHHLLIHKAHRDYYLYYHLLYSVHAAEIYILDIREVSPRTTTIERGETNLPDHVNIVLEPDIAIHIQFIYTYHKNKISSI